MKHIWLMIVTWYLMLTFLALFGAHTLSFQDVFPGLVLTWLLALFFLAGFASYHARNPVTAIPASLNNKSVNSHFLKLISIGSIFLSAFVIQFYTGNTILEVLGSLTQQESLYVQYQTYFREQELWRFSIEKLPAIFAAMLLKLTVIYVFITVIARSRRLTIGNLAAMITAGSSYMLFAAARGTSFELFEILLLIWLSFSVKSLLEPKATFVFSKRAIAFAIVAVSFLTIYNFNITGRTSASIYCSTAELCLDPNAFLYAVSYPLGELSFRLSSYFTFGIYFSSSFIDSVWLSSPMNVLRGFFPLAFDGYSNGIRGAVCNVVIDCGVAWIPDAMVFLQYLGILGLFALTFILGRLAKVLAYFLIQGSEFHKIGMLYFVVLVMFSLPVGNFLFVSSSNTLVLVLIILMHFNSRLASRRSTRKRLASVSASLPPMKRMRQG